MRSITETRAFWENQSDVWSSSQEHFLSDENKHFQQAVKQGLIPLITNMQARPGRILDLGGAGTTSQYLPGDLLKRTTVMDLSLPALKSSATHETVLGNVEDPFPFHDETFGFVTMFFLPRYINGFLSTIDQVRRVLKPHGMFAALDFTTIGYQNEMREFRPYSLVPTLELIGFSEVKVNTLYPELHVQGSPHMYHGPLHLLTAEKM